MLEVRAPWWARIPLVGNLGAPIIFKEVYSLVRRNRWFWAQFIYLIILAGGMAMIYAGNASTGTPPEVLGAQLVNHFFTLQIGLVCLIFPGLASTSISAERVEKSFDLLVVSDLTPAELVWGKLIGILGSAFYFLISTLPILGVCIFFGGLSPWAIAFDYFVLLVLAVIVSSWGVLISSMSRNNLLSIIGSYAGALILGFFLVGFFGGVLPQMGARGLWDAIEMAPPGVGSLVVWSVSELICVFVVVCLLGAMFFLSSPESNRGTPIRVFLTILVFLGILFTWMTLDTIQGTAPRASANDLGRTGTVIINMAATFLLFVLVAVAGSRVETPLRAVRLASLRPARWYSAWPLIGGGIRGLVLSIVLLALALLSIEGVLGNAASLVTPPANAGPDFVPQYRSIELSIFFGWVTHLVGAWVFAYLGFAFFLSTLGLRGGINWFLTIGVSVLLILLSIGRLATVPFRQHAEMTMFSPIVTLISLPESQSRFPASGPEIDACVVGHWLIGAVLMISGLAIMKSQKLPWVRFHRPGYEFLVAPPEAPESGSLQDSSRQTSQSIGGHRDPVVEKEGHNEPEEPPGSS